MVKCTVHDIHLLTVYTHLHAQMQALLTIFVTKFALHDIKLLRKTTLWGGGKRGGIYVYMNRNLHASGPKAQADYQYYCYCSYYYCCYCCYYYCYYYDYYYYDYYYYDDYDYDYDYDY